MAVLGFFIEIDERINKADIEESFQDFFHESFGMKNVEENDAAAEVGQIQTPIASTYTDLDIMYVKKFEKYFYYYFIGKSLIVLIHLYFIGTMAL